MRTSDKLEIGRIYTRRNLQKFFRITDASLQNGVFHPKGHDSVWLFVTRRKPPKQTQYVDSLDGELLHWDGQTQGRSDHLIIEHKPRGLEIVLFYRESKNHYPNFGFRYEGQFEYVSHHGSHPSQFTLRRVSSIEANVVADLDSLIAEEEYFEGSKKQRFTNYYERNPRLRAAAIANHGTKCMACGFDFEMNYGEHGKGFIEVHHMRPISNLRGQTKIDPKVDMVVLCSNCHRMIHRRKDKVLALEELKKILSKGETRGGA